MRQTNYPYLTGKIAERGIRYSVIAQRLGINAKTLYNKMFGNSEFSFQEASIIRRDFFPEIEYDQLMS